MTENQLLRKELYLKENSLSKAKEAYEFIMGSDEVSLPRVSTPTKQEDGIWLITNDGSIFEPKECSVSEIEGIVLYENGEGIIINPFQYEGQLQYEEEMCLCHKEERRECFAIMRKDDKEGTVAFLANNSPAAKLVRDLRKDWNIPSLYHLAMIYRHKDELNEVLEKIDGAEPFSAAYYWSATEYNTLYAWSVYFLNGYITFNTKYSSFAVRPVCALPQ